MTYQCNRTCNQGRPREDKDPPRKEKLHGHGDNRAHDINEEPAVVEFSEAFSITVIVDENFESDTGDEPSFNPFEDEYAVHLE